MLAQLLKTHYRLGFTRMLLCLDLLFLAVIALDLISYDLRGLSVVPVVRVSTTLPYELGIPVLNFVFFLMIVAPFSMAMLKIAGVPGFVTVNPVRRPHFVLAAHVLLCAGFCYMAVLTERMEVLSGWKQLSDGFALEFQSIFGSIVRSPIFTDALKAVASLAGVAISAAAGYVLIGKELSKPLQQYLVRAELADLPSELRPRTRSRLLFIDASAAPFVPATSEVAQEILGGYYSKSLTMSQQNAYIDRVLTECLLMSCNLLFDRDDLSQKPDVPNVAFYTGTGYAFEAAIACVGGAETFVVSPHVTPSTKRLMESYSVNASSQLIQLSITPSERCSSWNIQEDAIVSALQRAPLRGKVVFMVSEVCYATGLRIPLKRLIRRVKTEITNRELSIIVDGTNAVGNACRAPLGADWDAYVIAPYRWLMVTERCAIVATKNALRPKNQAYESVNEGGRKRDEDVRLIASLRAGLEGIQTTGMEYFWSRCESLRQSFRVGLPKSFQIAGSNSGMDTTYILSCFPMSSWRFGQREMNDQVTRRCKYASMINLDSDHLWLRLAIPYHLDPLQLNRVNEWLDDNAT